MKKQMRRCKHCHCRFEVCNKVKKHEYCKKKACQKARKRKWQKQKLIEDEKYRMEQKDANDIWRRNNPGYWKSYRNKNKQYTERNREKQRIRNRNRRAKHVDRPDPDVIAKMDAIPQNKHAFSGRYELIPFTPGQIAKMDAIIVEINMISSCYT